MNRQSNDHLARLIANNNPSPLAKAPKSPADRSTSPQPGRGLDLGRQNWTFGARKTGFEPLSEREVRALFAALSKGTKIALGREPTVAELVRLREQINDARALVASMEATLAGSLNVHIQDGRPVFNDPAQPVSAADIRPAV